MSGPRLLSCVIIDEDAASRQVLSTELRRRSGEYDLIGVYSCFKEGIQRIHTQVPHVVFLDIGAPFFTGREMLGVVSMPSYKVVLLATEQSYVHQPIKTSRFDCLLKPIAKVDLRRTLDRLQEGSRRLHGSWPIHVNHADDFVFGKMALPTTNGHVFIDPSDIVYCEADEEYTRIKTVYATHLICKHLKYFEARLSSGRFFRVHKSYLLNIDHIRSMLRTEGGHVIMSDDKLIPIGRSRRKEFSLLLGV